jgi:hypothetical protein
MNNPDADGYAALREACAEAIAGGTVRAEYRDAELMAQLFWACVHGVVSLQITHEHDPWITWTALEMRTRRVIEMSIRGMLTPEAAREWAL